MTVSISWRGKETVTRKQLREVKWLAQRAHLVMWTVNPAGPTPNPFLLSYIGSWLVEFSWCLPQYKTIVMMMRMMTMTMMVYWLCTCNRCHTFCVLYEATARYTQHGPSSGIAMLPLAPWVGLKNKSQASDSPLRSLDRIFQKVNTQRLSPSSGGCLLTCLPSYHQPSPNGLPQCCVHPRKQSCPGRRLWQNSGSWREPFIQATVNFLSPDCEGLFHSRNIQ